MKFWKYSILLFLSIVIFIAPKSVSAATFYSGENVQLSADNKNLSDLYLFGGGIILDSPVENDVLIAGREIDIKNLITGGLIAVGAELELRSTVSGSVRIAGGDIVIDGPVGRDVVVIGGSLKTTKNASIGGDLVFTGGSLDVNGPIHGKVIANGNNVNLKNTIDGSVSGEMGNLIISNGAKINGDLRYKSDKKAVISESVVIKGENVFQKIERSEDVGRNVGKIVNAGTFYKLITDILFSLLLIILVPRLLRTISKSINSSKLRSGVIGVVALLVLPFLSLVLLLIIWLGIFSLLLYLLLFVTSMVIANVYAGEQVLKWWNKRNGMEYILDWKAGVVGPVLLYILWLIPVIGWLAAFIIYLMSFGGLVVSLSSVIESQKISKRS